MATYAILREGREGDDLADLDERLGFPMNDDEPDEDDSDPVQEAADRRARLLAMGGELQTVA